MAKTKILFNKATIGFVLEALGYSINEKGYVISNLTGCRALDKDGKAFKANKVIGILNNEFITKESQLIETFYVQSRDNYTI